MRNLTRFGALPMVLAGALTAGSAFAADNEDSLDAALLVQEAASVMVQMKADPNAAALLQQAAGVFVVPNFTNAAVIVGGWGGDGVLVANQGAAWSGPAFYDISALSAGAQIGFTEGSAVMLLMSDQAVSNFKTGDGFSLEASADFSIVDFSVGGEASTRSDVIVWSQTEGLYAGLSASASDIVWDEEANDGYYGQSVSAAAVIEGSVQDPDPNVDPLTQAVMQ